MRRLLLLGLLVATVALVVSCGGDDDSSSASGSDSSSASSSGPIEESGAGSGDTTVAAELSEFAIKLDKQSAPTGKITFNAENKGAIAHELVVFRTDLAPDKLPVADGKVDETKLEGRGEIEEFDAGKKDSATFTLAPGKFVVICNVPAHYEAGMHIAFTVQ